MTKPRLKISTFVLNRFKHIKLPSNGKLYGCCLQENTILILGFTITSQKKVEDEKEEEDTLTTLSSYDFLPNLPAEVDFCGAFYAGEENLGSFTKILEDIDVTDNPVLLKTDLESKEIKGQFFLSNKLVDTDFEEVSQAELSIMFATLQLKAQIPLACEFNIDSVGTSVGFQISDCNIHILGGDTDGLSGASGESTVGELFSDNPAEGSVRGKAKTQIRQKDVLSVGMFWRCTQSDAGIKTAPVISYLKKNFNLAKLQLQVDSLAFVNRQTKLNQVFGILVEALCRSLRLSERCLLAQMDKNKPVSLPRTFHFLPRECGHTVTAAYPSSEPLNFKAERETLHILLNLPTDRPIFRPGNEHCWAEASSLLVNPHEGLGPSGVQGGEIALVKGAYHYHHYMQDKMDDNGWGCAYRSLQTIISWFRLQGYSSKPVPTHRMIQQCLVHIGDKPLSFVGSRQWIGSTEVSFCLETMLDVTSRIVAVRSGEELSMKGSELIHHFNTQGTPIMIGGGVLAHTILGVDFNRRAGVLKFLILDPHYTGSEDLNVIQNKGWCGWKGMDFWKKNAFYNMCLPQRPKCV